MIQSFEQLVPRVHETAWVHEGAWVIGDVRLGPRVSVWPGAVLRGDMGAIVVGADSNLQDGVVCHDTTGVSETILGEKVTVGHAAILHGCIIEDWCLVGMGAIVMDNARIGTGSIIGAGALVPANKVIPPGSLVIGSPGRVVRTLTEADRETIDEGWQSYTGMVARWKQIEASAKASGR